MIKFIGSWVEYFLLYIISKDSQSDFKHDFICKDEYACPIDDNNIWNIFVDPRVNEAVAEVPKILQNFTTTDTFITQNQPGEENKVVIHYQPNLPLTFELCPEYLVDDDTYFNKYLFTSQYAKYLHQKPSEIIAQNIRSYIFRPVVKRLENGRVVEVVKQ